MRQKNPKDTTGLPFADQVGSPAPGSAGLLESWEETAGEAGLLESWEETAGEAGSHLGPAQRQEALWDQWLL